MNHPRSITALLCALLLCISPSPASADSIPAPSSTTQVYFSPDGGCTEAIIQALANAKTRILIQAYSFTSAPIARAIVNAHLRGVEVTVILDKSNKTTNYSSADFLAHEGVSVLIDAKHSIAHNKIMVIDSHLILTGSFNFTKAAEEKNAENLLVIDDPKLAALYLKNWTHHQQHSTPYQAR